jgi:hypothetical protein
VKRRAIRLFAGAHGSPPIAPSPPPARAIVVVGGGAPAAAALLTACAEALLAAGQDVELHLDPTDPALPVGLELPRAGLGVLTLRHPWAASGEARPVPEDVVQLPSVPVDLRRAAEARACHARALAQLEVARVYRREIEGYLWEAEAVDAGGLNQLAAHLIDEATGGQARAETPRRRRLFASAPTAEGVVHTLDTLLQPTFRRYYLAGDPGVGKATLVERVASAAAVRGFDVIACHCGLRPERVEHVLLPSLGTALVNAEPPHALSPRRRDRVLDLGAFVDRDRLQRVAHHLGRAQALYQAALERAVAFLAEEKRLSDGLVPSGWAAPPADALERAKDALLERLGQPVKAIDTR